MTGCKILKGHPGCRVGNRPWGGGGGWDDSWKVTAAVPRKWWQECDCGPAGYLPHREAAWGSSGG